MKIILASTSPRRKEMMDWLGIPYETISPELDESLIRHEDPEKLTQLLAEAKVEAVKNGAEGGIIIGSDAIVCFDNHILEKARDREHQRELINMQKGKMGQTISSICVVNLETGERVTRSEITSYKVAEAPDHLVEAYIESGKGLDKAGGFGLQDENGFLLEEFYGCYPNLIGFPICLVSEILQKMGVGIDVDIKQEVEKRTGKRC